jgi:hypothetical protein
MGTTKAKQRIAKAPVNKDRQKDKILQKNKNRVPKPPTRKVPWSNQYGSSAEKRIK